MPPHDPAELTDIERERMVLRHGVDQDSRTVRIAGILAMSLGFVLIVMIGAIAYYTVPIMLGGGETVDGSRFTGGRGARLVILAVYAAVAAIGFIAMLSGAVHIATGKRFAPGIKLMVGFVSLLVMLGMVVRALG